MSQFDPTQRRETWVLQSTGNIGRDNKPTYKRAKFMWVEYDGDPGRYMEPCSHIRDFHDVQFGNPVIPEQDGTLIHGFEIIDSVTINEVHRFD
jgi:hypothetical protein